MPLPRPSSPRVLWADLRAFTRERGRHQWIAAAAAILMPAIILVTFYYDAQTNTAPGEQIIYAESWSADRTDAEIVARQKIDQERRQAALKARQEEFKKLEDRFGIE